jgi:diacylglycerol kinase (ATP)
MRRIINAFWYSLSGLRLAWRDEAAFRQEVALAIVLLPLGAWLAENGVELALLWLSVLLVLVAELLNSAVEAAIDRIGEEIHPLSKKAKDVGSAAVLVALVACALVWGAVLLA